MLVLKACPRCHGDLMLEVTRDADYYECLQCGHVLTMAQENLLGIPPTHARRFTRRSQYATSRPRPQQQARPERRQPSGKIILTYAVEGDFDLSGFRSNTFTLEWPRGSGRTQEFPEMDRAEWMTIDRASEMLVKGQVPILGDLRDYLIGSGRGAGRISRG